MTPTQTTCRNCGKPFTPRHGRQIYCCNGCARFIEASKLAGQRNSEVKPASKLRPCATCKTLITDYRCPECWAKIRGRGWSEAQEDVVTYSVGVM